MIKICVHLRNLSQK